MRVALLCNNLMAIPALQSMIREDVVCAVATTDKDAEVGRIFKDIAGKHNIPYLQVSRLDYVAKLDKWLDEFQPDVVFVMTFAWRIPRQLLEKPKWGFVNFHYGLLPEMRGADPIFECIRQQRTAAGLTVHVMDEGLDTGPIIMREEIAISTGFTYGILCGLMARTGERMCMQLIDHLGKEGRVVATPQDESAARYWPKRNGEELTIAWNKMNAAEIIALIRSCNPVTKGVPVAINGWQFGVCDATEVNLQGDASVMPPGIILAIDQQNGLIVNCKDGLAVKLDVVNTAEGFFPGHKLAQWGISAGMLFN